jgi:rfaE bifunctional protein nucleotidyltransferase chain/domain
MNSEVAQVLSDKRIMDHVTLLRMVNIWKFKDDRIVFTNGCFDLLHRGHVQYLQEAAAVGDRLIVGVNSDTSVMRQGKGPGRPVNDQLSRMLVLAALRCVDAVTLFEEDTPLELVRSLRPDVLVKGGDWPLEKIVGADLVRSYGGEVRSIPVVAGFSSTAMIGRIRNV